MTQTNEHVASLQHVIGPRGRFTLRQASGEITIRGVEGDTVRVRSLDGDQALTEHFQVDTGDGFLDLRQHDKFGLGIKLFSRGESPEIEVEVPHGATISVETASAEVQASDLSGTKRFRTASGELQLHRFAGVLDAETVSGDVDIEGQAPLDLVTKSISGDIRVRVPRLRRMDMGSTSGDIWLDAELVGDGPFALRSISGDVTIVGRSGFRVEAETITGDMSSELAHKRESMPGRRVLTVGRPGPTLQFRSVSGDLQIVQPRDAAPESLTPPAPPSPPPAPEAPAAPTPDVDATRLEILRELERGDITVAEATDRLASLDEVAR
jgi:Putative adhesin